MSCNTADINSDITDTCDLKCKLVTDYPSQGIECTGYETGDHFALQLSIAGIENLTSELNFTPYTGLSHGLLNHRGIAILEEPVLPK